MPESVALMERSRTEGGKAGRPDIIRTSSSGIGRSVWLEDGSPDDRHEATSGLSASRSGSSGTSTPRRARSPSQNSDGGLSPSIKAPLGGKSNTPSPRSERSGGRHVPNDHSSGRAAHSSPLNIGKKLAALQNAAADSLPGGSAAGMPVQNPSQSRTTLKVRHSDSFDGSSYVSSSDGSDAEPDDALDPRTGDPDATPRLLSSIVMSSRTRTRSQDTVTDASGRGVAGRHGGAGQGAEWDETVDLDDEERGLAMESDYFASNGIVGPGEKGRVADQAGAILGIANMWVCASSDTAVDRPRRLTCVSCVHRQLRCVAAM